LWRRLPTGVDSVYTLPGRQGGWGRVEDHLLPPWPWEEATFVVVPDPQLTEVAQAQHVREVEGISVVPLKLVPVGRLF
jgi:hypothetical protein